MGTPTQQGSRVIIAKNDKTYYVLTAIATTQNIDVWQIRAVDYSRVLDLVGVLEEEYWEPIRTAVNLVLGFVV